MDNSSAMKFGPYLLFFLFLLPFCSLAQVSESSGTRRLNSSIIPSTKAVVIGISDYEHINDLKYADDDAIALATYLAEHPDVEKENVVLLLDSLATKNTVRKAIYTTLNQAKKNEQVIIYFAGHGDANNATSLVDAGYLLCHNVSKNATYELDDAINITDIQKWVDAAVAKGVYVVLMIDACRAGRFINDNSQATIAKALSGLAQGFQNSIKLISCQPNQLSYEDAKWGGGHGVFTHYLLEGLKGAAVDTTRSREIEVYELFKYIEEQTVADTERKQIPLRGGNSTHKILRYYKNDGEVITVDIPSVELFPRDNISKKTSMDVAKDKLSESLGSLSNGTYKSVGEDYWKEGIKSAEKLIKKEKDETLKARYIFQKNLLEGYAAIASGRTEDIDKMEAVVENLYTSHSESAPLLNLLGEFAQLKGEQNKAIYYFNQSKQKANHWLQPQANLASSYLAKQDVELAYRVAYENLRTYKVSKNGIMQLDTLFAIAKNSLEPREVNSVLDEVLKLGTSIGRQDNSEQDVLALIDNFSVKHERATVTDAVYNIIVKPAGEALFLASQNDFSGNESFNELQKLLGEKFRYFVDTSFNYKEAGLLDKISYKGTGYGGEAQSTPKLLYLKGHIYQYNNEKYLVESENTPKTASFVPNDYLTITDILETIDRIPNKQVLLILDVDNPDALDFSPQIVTSYNYQQNSEEIAAETHKRIIADRHGKLTRLLLVPERKANASQFISNMIAGLNSDTDYGLKGVEQIINGLDAKPLVSSFGYHEEGGFLFIDGEATESYNAELYKRQLQKGDSLVAENAFEEAIEAFEIAFDYIKDDYFAQLELQKKVDETWFKKDFYDGSIALEIADCKGARNYFLDALSTKPNDSNTLQKIIECDACLGKKSAGIE